MRPFLLSIVIAFIANVSLSQNVPVLKITDLEKRIKNNSDTTYIVNFWATWCVPCVKELPAFDSIRDLYINKKVKMILVSMDFKEDLKTKLLPFLNTHHIKSEVVLLDEVNGNYFIPKVSSEWTGAIPATLIVNNKKQVNHFFEKKLKYDFLKTEIETLGFD